MKPTIVGVSKNINSINDKFEKFIAGTEKYTKINKI